MNMTYDRIGISHPARRQLITLKRRTNILDDSALLRWGLCTSLAMADKNCRILTEPRALEMSWHEFGGPYHEQLLAYLKVYCFGTLEEFEAAEETAKSALFECARFHIERGLAHIYHHPGIRSAADLITLIDLDIGGLKASLLQDVEPSP